MKTIIVVNNLDHDVKLEQSSNGKFRVTYGKQVTGNMSYIAAAHEFGECVLHSAQCANMLAD
jgi:hypothetical protein